MRRFRSLIYLVGGLGFALAAFLPVSGQASEIVVNKKPLKDFAETVKRLDETKRVDWTKPFAIEIEGVLAKNGRLDKTTVAKTEGDAELIGVAKQGIFAVGESGWLGYLSSYGVEKIMFVIEQTPETFSFTAIPEFSTPERAKMVASGVNMMIKGTLALDKNGAKKLGDDERALLSNTIVTSSEKTANIIFTMPAGELREMIRRKIEGSKEKANG